MYKAVTKMLLIYREIEYFILISLKTIILQNY